MSRPSPMKINHLFSIENFKEPQKIDWVKEEANYLLKIMKADPNFILAERFGHNMSPAALEHFFRHKERSEKICQIIQYLLAFLAHIPANSEMQRVPVNPADQFRAFIRYEADLLLEEDVKNAVFQETNQRDHFHAGTIWDFQENILNMNRKLTNMITKEESTIASSISNLCRVLEHLCLFWFDLRRHDLRRTRRSDIFIYLLAQLVRNRCWLVGKPISIQT
jgi:hypothetical protein